MSKSPPISTKRKRIENSFDENNNIDEVIINDIDEDPILPLKKTSFVNDFDDVPIPSANTCQNNGEYNLNDLPPEAFAGGNFIEENLIEEEVITPKILSLESYSIKNKKDLESDINLEPFIPKDQAIKDFLQFIGPSIQRQIESRQFKQKIKGCNEIQNKLEEFSSLDDKIEIIFRGLEKSPSWKENNISVLQIMIDIIRHVIVKSKEIKKASLTIVLSFLFNKVSEKKLKSQIEELIFIIAQITNPSFLLFQMINLVINQKLPKLIVSILEISIEIIKNFGPGEISLIEYIPKLKILLQHSNPDIKNLSTTIISYLFKSFGQSISESISDLPKPILDRILSEFENSSQLPNPTKQYSLHSNDNKIEEFKKLTEKKPRNKLTKYVTQEKIDLASEAKKWAEQKEFLESIENGLKECKDRIVSTD